RRRRKLAGAADHQRAATGLQAPQRRVGVEYQRRAPRAGSRETKAHRRSSARSRSKAEGGYGRADESLLRTEQGTRERGVRPNERRNLAVSRTDRAAPGGTYVCREAARGREDPGVSDSACCNSACSGNACFKVRALIWRCSAK